MKHFSASLFTLFLAGTVLAQIPNNGFEDWSGNVPDNWSNNNLVPFNAFAVRPSENANSGSFAARGEVIVSPLFEDQVMAPFLQSISQANITNDPAEFSGWYQFAPIQSSASFVLSCTVIDGSSLPTGIGVLEITEATDAYTSFNIPIDYTMGGTEPATTAIISFTIADDNDLSAIGSWFLVDDLSLGGTVGIEDLHSVASIGKPFPSPFSSSVTIPIEMESTANIRIEVFDMLGRPVHTIANSKFAKGTHRLQWAPEGNIPNGIYTVRFSNSIGATSRRVALQR